MKYDEIGYWSEVKLDIIREYGVAYSTILSKQPRLKHVYIDAFAGAGTHISRRTRDFVPGSPLNALNIVPPFNEFYFIDLNREKVDALRRIAGERPEVIVYEGNCNSILLNEVFPHVRYEDYRRGLCLLDPYGLHLNWEVMLTAGTLKTIDMFLNFPVMDMNMNVLWHDPDRVDPVHAARMDAFWGDGSWRNAAYDTILNLFGYEEKLGNEAIVNAFQDRLKKVAGFSYVPDPIPMRNSINAIVYYLFFASQKPVAHNIVKDIFDKYRNKGIS